LVPTIKGCPKLQVAPSDLQRILQEHRLLAAVIAKNAVGNAWQNIVDGRELSAVPAEEKESVRQKALPCLLLDPSTAVATQVWQSFL